MPAKSKRLTNKEKTKKKKRQFSKEVVEQFVKEINLMNPFVVFWSLNALTLVTAGTDVLPITSEQVGVFKLMKISAEIKKLHEETKKSGKEVTVRDVCKISDSIMKQYTQDIPGALAPLNAAAGKAMVASP